MPDKMTAVNDFLRACDHLEFVRLYYGKFYIDYYEAVDEKNEKWARLVEVALNG